MGLNFPCLYCGRPVSLDEYDGGRIMRHRDCSPDTPPGGDGNPSQFAATINTIRALVDEIIDEALSDRDGGLVTPAYEALIVARHIVANGLRTLGDGEDMGT